MIRIWLFQITWKRRKGRPQEYIAACCSSMFGMLLFHQHLCAERNVPTSWVTFTLHTPVEAAQLAPDIYKALLEKERAA